MTRQLVLAHDLGTTTNKAILLSEQGKLLATATAPYPMHSPEPGFAEQDPEDWWRAVVETTARVMTSAGAHGDEVKAVSFTGQMQGTLPVDGEGRPLMRCMTWLDTRAKKQAREVTRGTVRAFGYGVTRLARWLWLTSGGPSLAGTDPISKIVWLRQNRPGIWRETRKLLDAKDYLLFRATGRLVTTHDCANLTWLMDTRPGKRGWSETLLEMIDLDEGMLPHLVPATEIVGPLGAGAAQELGLKASTLVVAGSGDVAAMAIGAGAVRMGVLHLALGTSSWIAAHHGRRASNPFAYIGAMCSAHPSRYLVVAAQQNAGSVIDWVRGNVLAERGGPISHEDLGQMVSGCEPGSSKLSFLPWLVGERTPIDDPHARGGFINLTLGHRRPHLARAVFEGVAFNTRWALTKLEPMIGGAKEEGVRFVGGGARSDVLAQIMADVLDRPLLLGAQPEFAAARGCALLASLVTSPSGDFDGIEARVPIEKRFDPRRNLRSIYDDGFASFKNFYRRNRGWFERQNSSDPDRRTS